MTMPFSLSLLVSSDMKIVHGSRQACMPETLLYLKDSFTIFLEMCCCTMTKIMSGDSMVKAGLHQGVFKDGTDIPGIDTLWSDTPAMGHEHVVVTGIPFPEDTQQGELLLGNDLGFV